MKEIEAHFLSLSVARVCGTRTPYVVQQRRRQQQHGWWCTWFWWFFFCYYYCYRGTCRINSINSSAVVLLANYTRTKCETVWTASAEIKLCTRVERNNVTLNIFTSCSSVMEIWLFVVVQATTHASSCYRATPCHPFASVWLCNADCWRTHLKRWIHSNYAGSNIN